MKQIVVLLLTVLAVGTTQEPRPSFSTETELVPLNVLARHRGMPLTNLGIDDFEVTDSGVRQRVDSVRGAEASVQAWVVLDQSGSVKDHAVRLREAGDTFADELSERDRVGLITFRHGVRLRRELSPPGEFGEWPLTSAEGFTSFRDALSVALALRDGRLDQALILALSDGTDTMSWTTEPQLDIAIGRSDAVIYAVAPDVGDAPGARYLRHLVDQTGGRIRPLESRPGLAAALREVLAEVKSRYVLTYYPAGVTRSGWRDVSVRLTRRAGTLKVRQRYFVPPRPVNDG